MRIYLAILFQQQFKDNQLSLTLVWEYKIFATLPVSSATAERSFSALKYLKSYLRSTMSEDRLNGLALAYIHRDLDQHIIGWFAIKLTK